MLGMKRQLPKLLEFSGPTINVGSSEGDRYTIPDAIAIGRPQWIFPCPLPFVDNSIATIHCYHFLEHLDGDNAIAFLRECERVMIPGASVMNFCMPYYNSHLMAECLDHKSFWNEDTFRNLFDNPGFDIAGKWSLRTHFVLVAGIKEDNLAVIGQLFRENSSD